MTLDFALLQDTKMKSGFFFPNDAVFYIITTSTKIRFTYIWLVIHLNLCGRVNKRTRPLQWRLYSNKN